MVMFVQSVYPCESCKQKIDTESRFCPLCGAKQSPLEHKIQYNIFTRMKGRKGAFNLNYGATILEQSDVLGRASMLAGLANGWEHYIGGYIQSEQPAGNEEHSCQYEMKTCVWIPVNEDGTLGECEGPQVITITTLE